MRTIKSVCEDLIEDGFNLVFIKSNTRLAKDSWVATVYPKSEDYYTMRKYLKKHGFKLVRMYNNKYEIKVA